MQGHRQDAWQEAAMTAGPHQKRGRGKEGVRPESQREPGPADTLIWNFQTLELRENKFVLFKPPSL